MVNMDPAGQPRASGVGSFPRLTDASSNPGGSSALYQYIRAGKGSSGLRIDRNAGWGSLGVLALTSHDEWSKI